jgi:ABC-type ATPase with predicted acetyltransferase domain
MPRNISEQYLKLQCLTQAPIVIRKSKIIADIRTYEIVKHGKKTTVVYYALQYAIKKGEEIKVIVQRKGTGKYTFLSIMNSKKRIIGSNRSKKHP